MDSIELGFLTVLSHVDPFYDPAKAHDYYLRTRQLKGRPGGKAAPKLSKEQRQKQTEGQTYVRAQVREAQKADLAKAAESNKQAVEQLRQLANQRRVDFQAKLKDLVNQISTQSTTSAADIDKKAQAAIDALPKTPDGLSPAQASAWADDRRNKIAEIRGNAIADKGKLSGSSKQALASQQADVQNQRLQMANNLKDSLNKAKDNYKAAVEGVKAKYQEVQSTEFDKLSRANA